MHYVVRNERIRQQAIAKLQDCDLVKPVEVIIRNYDEKRSLEQNALFHAICREVSEEYAALHGRWFSPDVWKMQFKDLFLGSEPRLLPSGKLIEEPISTAKLSAKAMSQLIEKVIYYCADEIGIVIQQRDPYA